MKRTAIYLMVLCLLVLGGTTSCTRTKAKAKCKTDAKKVKNLKKNNGHFKM